VSVGGQFFDVKWNEFSDDKVKEIEVILDEYGFDGLDLDFEGSHIPGGRDADTVGQKIKGLVNSRRGGDPNKFWLTAAPEWPYVTEYSYGGLQNQNYKQLFKAIGMDVFTFIWPQMYNLGGNGIKDRDDPKDKIDPKTDIVEFLAEMEYQTTRPETGGIHMPKDKLVLGIPASEGAAGQRLSFVATPSQITAAFNAACKLGTKIRGFMTWSADFDNKAFTIPKDSVQEEYHHEAWETVTAIIKGETACQ
jgi:chitinase